MHFDVFEVDLRSGELRRPGSKARLQDQPLQILALLLEHAGEVVTRAEIEKRLWPDGVVVDFEHSINSAVKRLRKALGDDAEHPRYIETLPRLGYRFIGQVGSSGGLCTAPPPARPDSVPAEVTMPDVPEGPLSNQTFAVGVRAQNMSFARRRDGKLLYAMGTLGVMLAFALAVGLDIGGLRDRLLWTVGTGHGVPLPKIESIAVLPFENLTGDPQQEYLADGMTDGLVTNLGKIGALRVISRTTGMHYKGTRMPLPEIASELHVDAIVEGTVQGSGNRLRITANLLFAPTDRHLWSESYERDLGDVLVLQSELTRAIAGQINVKLTPQEHARLASSRPVNPEAYRLCLLGRFYWNKRTEDGFRKAIGFFQRAIEIDPSYAPGYAGVADSYNLLGDYSYLRPRDAYPKAKAAVRKALQFDESSAETHTSLAFVQFDYDWDWASSEKEYKRAIELNPNYGTAHQWYSDYLSAMRRYPEALAESKRALELDPLSPAINVNQWHRYWFMRQYDTEIRGLQETASLFPEFSNTYGTLAFAYLATGRHQEAIVALQKLRSLSGASPADIAALAQAYAKGGMRGYYLWEIRRLTEESKHRYVRPAHIARLFTYLGEKDQAFSYLEKAYDEHDWHLTRLQVDPVWDPLRSDPRFQDLVRRMNFPK